MGVKLGANRHDQMFTTSASYSECAGFMPRSGSYLHRKYVFFLNPFKYNRSTGVLINP